MPVFTTDDGVRLAYREQGQGARAVLFVHGWSTDGAVWDQLFAALKDEPLRLVAVDLRGTGGSDRVATGAALERHVQDVRALARHLGLRRYAVVGHSMGGQVAQLLAARAPGELDGAVLVCAVPARGLPLPPPVRALFRGATGDAQAFETIYRQATRQLPAGALAALVAMSLAQQAPAIEGGYDAFTGASFEPELEQIRCPVLVLATDDPFLSPAVLRELQVKKIPGAALAYLPGPGHYPQVEAPAQTAAVVAAFLAGLPRV
ncbi:MAG: alpha/beta hydrolase [Myxococcaceae bacterium]|nr:alpha/beta hydrolase [Myxococcaceae bacterium]